jgi:hypothetical protein
VADTIEELTSLFTRLGAPDPASWARSQVTEGFSQLHRYLFLRQAWSKVVADGDVTWIDANIAVAEQRPQAPFSGIGHALKRLISGGAAPEDLTEIVRGMQADLLFGICYLLEDPGLDDEELEHIGWRLVETDADYDPTDRPICSLHESVLETDPTGREMRPKETR